MQEQRDAALILVLPVRLGLPGFIRGFPKSLSATLAVVPCISSFPFSRFLIFLESPEVKRQSQSDNAG